MSNLVTFTKTLAAANAAIIAASQTPGGAGNLTLVGGGKVTLDTARQVIFTFAANETGHTFTVFGTSDIGGLYPISETVAGTAAGVVPTVRMYGTITRIAISAAATGALTVGTNGIGATDWVASNYQISPSNWSFACVVTGTVNYTIQETYDDFWTVQPGTTQGNVPVAFSDAILVNQAATNSGVVTNPITGWRLLINSGTGSVALKAVQAGILGSA